MAEEKLFYTLGRRQRAELNKQKPEGDGGFHTDTRWQNEGDAEKRL
jgi:hypothetical protein